MLKLVWFHSLETYIDRQDGNTTLVANLEAYEIHGFLCYEIEHVLVP